MELSPFGVGVLEVVTGAVKTNGQTYFGGFYPSSRCTSLPIEDTIAGRAQGKDQLPRMATVEYASAVADEITKRTGHRSILVPMETTLRAPR